MSWNHRRISGKIGRGADIDFEDSGGEGRVDPESSASFLSTTMCPSTTTLSTNHCNYNNYCRRRHILASKDYCRHSTCHLHQSLSLSSPMKFLSSFYHFTILFFSVVFFVTAVFPPLTSANRVVKVTCQRYEMKVVVSFPHNDTRIKEGSQDVQVYLHNLRGYPGCQPVIDPKGKTVTFTLSLDDDTFYACGTSKLRNKITGTKVFYHRVMIEERMGTDGLSSVSGLDSSSEFHDKNRVKESDSDQASSPTTGGSDNDWTQESVVVKCIIPGDQSTNFHHRIGKRDSLSSIRNLELPENFTESSEELIDYSGNVTAQVPLPLLNIAVKQNGQFVDTALNVSPGTPLEMIIYLDEVSANVYGLLTSFLRVTDNTPRKQEEIIILNGCSIDPYIFANFETDDGGKSVSAKFRAFKFPDSNYVLFVGTVNVCLKTCLPVQCGEGQLGYGRRRRKRSPVIPYQMPVDANKVFEAELTTFVKVGYGKDHPLSFYGKSNNNNQAKKRYHHQMDSRNKLVSYYHPLTRETTELSSESSISYSIPLSILVVTVALVFLILVLRVYKTNRNSSSRTSTEATTATSRSTSINSSVLSSSTSLSPSHHLHHHPHRLRIC